MNIGTYILNKMIREGADIPEEKKAEVIEEVNEAITDNHFFIIAKNGKDIGFFSYFEIRGRIFMNNCVIFKEFRSRTNLLSLRRLFKDKYKGRQFYWRSKKRNEKLCLVK